MKHKNEIVPDEVGDALDEGGLMPIEGKEYLCKVVGKFNQKEHITLLQYHNKEWLHMHIGIPITESYVVTHWKAVDEIFN